MKLLSIIMARDQLGHPISVNYEGNKAFQTKLGAFLTMAIQGLVLAFLAMTTIDLVNMNDPSIISYARPIYPTEIVEELDGELKLADYSFNFGVYVSKRNEDTEIEIPESIGKFMSYNQGVGPDAADVEYMDLVPCKDLFSDMNVEPANDKRKFATEIGKCIDGSKHSLNGTTIFGP